MVLVPALVYSLLIMGDVISILSEQQEAFVDEEIGDLLGEEADAIAADLGITNACEAPATRLPLGPRERPQLSPALPPTFPVSYATCVPNTPAFSSRRCA